MSLRKRFLNILLTKKMDVFGKDSLVMSSLPYYLITLILGISYFLLWNHAWTLMMVIFVIIPLLDEICTQDTRNPTEQQKRKLLENDIFFQIPIYTAILLDWIVFFKAMKYFSSFQFTFWNCYNLPAFFFIMGSLSSYQFTIAHELFHKSSFLNKVVSILQLSKNLYIHFYYQHVFGHHRTVGTPEDPSSAYQGETLYQFFPRTYFGCYKNVYNMQKDIDKQPFYLNWTIVSVVGAIAFIFGIYFLYNLQTTIFFVLQALLAIFNLESIDYIEHYGLRRKMLPNGEYEKVTIQHSWNSPHRFSNYIMLKDQRHSDHHQNSLKPYQTLLLFDQSPTFPHGYSMMAAISFSPSQWAKIMDPLLDEYKKQRIGPVKNEAIQKAITQTRAFAINIGLKVTLLWLISLVRLL